MLPDQWNFWKLAEANIKLLYGTSTENEHPRWRWAHNQKLETYARQSTTEESADKRLAPQDLDKQNNLKETKKTNIFEMLIETKKGKKSQRKDKFEMEPNWTWTN